MQSRKSSDSEEVCLPRDIDPSTFCSLSREQRITVNVVLYHLWLREELGKTPPQLRLGVTGTAGTGKTHIIKILTYLTRTIYGRNSCLQTVTPSGASASLVLGRTIHSLFKTPTGSKKLDSAMEPLSGDALSELQHSLNGLMVLIKDEFSMFGAQTYGYSEFQAKEGVAFGQTKDLAWGGIPIILTLGDPGQLPQVCEPSVWDCQDDGQSHDKSKSKKQVKPDRTQSCLSGRVSFAGISDWVGLEKVQHQQKSPCFACSNRWHPPGADCTLLKDTLLKMRFGPEMTQDDHKWLMQWQMHMFPLAKRDRMIKDALWVFPRKKDAAERNALTLVAMSQAGVPMVYCCSVDTGPCSKKAFVRSNIDGVMTDVQGLREMKSVLCRGARVTLLFNHYVEWNLFNGSQGQVVDIIYLNTRSPSVEEDSFPDLYMVCFPQYKGPAVLLWDPKVVPVVPVTKKHECAHAYCSRTQVPLLPDYKRTVHKCQGMTCGPGHPRECLVTDLGPGHWDRVSCPWDSLCGTQQDHRCCTPGYHWSSQL